MHSRCSQFCEANQTISTYFCRVHLIISLSFQDVNAENIDVFSRTKFRLSIMATQFSAQVCCLLKAFLSARSGCHLLVLVTATRQFPAIVVMGGI